MDNLYSSVSKGGCYDTNHYGPRPLPLLKQNYLGEYFTEAEKELVRQNLGIHNDSLVRKFIVENGLLKDQIPGHENISTIYGAICYLFEDLDVENKRINNLDNYSTALHKLTGIDKNNNANYIWPNSVNQLENGYLKELNSYIQNALNEIARVERKIGEMPDGSPVQDYINTQDDKIYEKIKSERAYVDQIIGEYSRDLNESDEIAEPLSKYGENNYAIRPALNDIDDRLKLIEELTEGGAGEIQAGINEYKRQVVNILAQINGGQLFDESNTATETVPGLKADIASAENSLKTTISTIQKDLSEKLGENGDFPTGLYADFKNYKNTLTSDFNSFEQTLSQDLNDLKSEIGNYTEGDIPASGLRKEVEEIQTNVSSYLEDCENTLVSKEKSLEAEAKTTLDTYVTNATADINKAVSDASQAASNAQIEANKALALVDSAKDEVNKATEAIEGAKAIAPNLTHVRIKTREGVEQLSAIPELDKDPITFEMGALGFYLNGEHLRTFAPGLGHSGDSEDKMATVITESDGTTKEYRSAFSLNYNSSDTVSAQLKTLQNGPEYRIPTIEFKATNVEIENGSKTSNKLKIAIVDTLPPEDQRDGNTFYYIKQS